MAHDEALLQLLEAWLALDNTPVEDVDNKPVDNVDSAQNKGCKRPASSVDHPEAKRHRAAEMDAAGKPPLRDILYLHQVLRLFVCHNGRPTPRVPCAAMLCRSVHIYTHTVASWIDTPTSSHNIHGACIAVSNLSANS